MKAGAADYLPKDYLTSPLLERSIRYAIGHSQAKQALRSARDELEKRVEERTAELAAANEALRKSVDKIKQFAYSVSHDLKNPAMGVHGLTRLLCQRYVKVFDETGRQYCRQIVSASRELLDLVEMINMYIRTKENPLAIQNLKLKKTLRSIRENLSAQLDKRQIRWTEPPSLPVIRGDRLLLTRALTNLVDNALKHGGDKLSAIQIGYEEKEDFHVLYVRDDGVGVQTEDDQDIFAPFMRLKRSQATEGTGLGLAIVKEIAEQHQGRVWAKPGSPRGVTFCISVAKSI
jgi:light-regulated signal transduction histidine kinase (bacteriophytochrome)